LIPLTVCPSLISRHGIIRFASIRVPFCLSL
jgi:hypothetical protein